MARKPEGILDHTIAFWQPHYCQELTDEDAREIVENVTQFFQILGEWDRQANRPETEPDNEPALMEADI